MIDFDILWNTVINDPELRNSHIHGPDHWARVERNGIYLGEQVGEKNSLLFDFLDKVSF